MFVAYEIQQKYIDLLLLTLIITNDYATRSILDILFF